MRLALGVLMLWLGCACLWVASRGSEAKTPWQVFEGFTGALRNS